LRHAGFSVAAFSIAAWTSTASATTESFPDFTDISPLTLSGSAKRVETTDGWVLRLTPATAYQNGSAFGTVTISAAQFYTSFAFRLTDAGGSSPDPNGRRGADGITFAIQRVSASLGSQGGGLGIENVKPSIAVEFDTYKNPEYMDPSSNHIGIDVNGMVVSVATVDVATPFNDGNLWYAWIDCDASTITVSVSQDGVRPAVPQLSYPIDVAQTVGASFAYVGFTAATGGGFQNHDILSWVYLDHFVAADAGAPPADGGYDGGGADGSSGGTGGGNADGSPSGSGGAAGGGTGGAGGSPGGSGGNAGTSGVGGNTSNPDGGALPNHGGGCGWGCDVGGGTTAGGVWLAAALLLALRPRRRNRSV